MLAYRISIVTWCYSRLVSRYTGIHFVWRIHRYSLTDVKKDLFFSGHSVAITISDFIFSREISTARRTRTLTSSTESSTPASSTSPPCPSPLPLQLTNREAAIQGCISYSSTPSPSLLSFSFISFLYSFTIGYFFHLHDLVFFATSSQLVRLSRHIFNIFLPFVVNNTDEGYIYVYIYIHARTHTHIVFSV